MSRATPFMNFSSVCEPLGPEVAAAVAVGVDVNRGVLAKFVGVRLAPLGGAEQPWLFAVPHAIDDGAARLPALLQEFAHRPRFFHLIHERGDGIFGAIHPGILVIAAHNPFVGGSRRRESGR